MTSSAIGTGMKVEIRLAKAIRSGVGSDSSDSHGISTRRVADTTLARSMRVMVGLSSSQTCLPKYRGSSQNTLKNGSWQSSGGGNLMAHVAASSTAENTGSGLSRSSHRINDGTTIRITNSRIAYLVRLMASGKAMKVIITTTGLKLGELNRKPSATSTRPFPRVTPQATGTAPLAQIT